MIYLKWFLLVIINLVTEYCIAFTLAPVVVLFANNDGWLPNWLCWFQTPDNPLDGDSGWKTENRPFLNENSKFKRWVNRFRWLHRNALYGFSEQVLGVKYQVLRDSLFIVGNPAVGNGPPGKSGVVKRYLYRNGKMIAFQWYYIRQYRRWPNKCIRVNLGWKLWNWTGKGEDSAMLVFSPSPYMHFLE